MNVDNLMAKISVLATKKVRRYACNRPGYKGNETEHHLSGQIDQLTEELHGELTTLIKQLGDLARAANSRGHLDPGGCDHNTELGHEYAKTQELLHPPP